MKIVRRLLFLLAGLLAVAALAVALAFTPAVQRWAALRALGGTPGLKVDVAQVAVRPGSAAVHQLDLAWPGGRLTLADATADLSLWELLVHRRVQVGSADVRGLKIDLTTPPGSAALAGAAAGPAAIVPAASGSTVAGARAYLASFDGVFNHLRLPVTIVLGRCQVEAQVTYPQPAGRPPGRMELTLRGGHFAPGQEARFDFDARLSNPDPSAPVATVETRGTLTLALDAQGNLSRINSQAQAEATGPKLAAPARLQAFVALSRTTTGESYAVLVDSQDGASPRHLLNLNVDYAPGSSRLAGTWQVAAGDRDVVPFALGLPLPEFSAVGEGRFELNPVSLAARLAGRLSGRCARLEVVDARLRDFDGLGVNTNFDVDYDGGSVRVTDLLAKVNGRQPLLTLQSIQPFVYSLGSHELVASDPQRELLQVAIEGVPVDWARPWLPPGFAVDGGELTGALSLALRDQSVWLHTVAPLEVRGLALTRAGRVLLPASDLTLQMEVEHARRSTRVNLTHLTLRTAAGDRLEAQSEVEATGGDAHALTAHGSFEGQLPTLLAAYVPLGPVQTHGQVAVKQTGNTVRVDQLALSVLTPDGRPVASLEAAGAFSVDLATGQVSPASGRPGDVLRLQLGRIPLALLQPYTHGLQLDGVLADAGLAVAARDGKLYLNAPAPWRVEQLAVGAPGYPWLRDLEIELQPAAEYSAGSVKASVTALRVRNAAGASLLTGHGEATVGPDFAPVKLQGGATFELAVPALAGQPLLAGAPPSAQGRLSGEAKFSLDHDLLAEGRLTLNGLVSPTTGEPLPVANLSFRAGVSEKGDVALQLPVLVDRAGERTDLTLAATLHPAPAGRTLGARITGAHVVVDDLMALVRPFALAPAAPAPTSPAAPAAAATAPSAAWAGLSGQVTLDVKSLVYGRSAEITGLTGRLTLDPRRVVVDQVAGKLGTDGQLKLAAEVGYTPGRPQPYSSKLDLNVQGFEVGPLFKVVAPDRPPTVEGRFDLRSHAEGAGATLGELLERTRGDLTMQSRKGTFRGLQQAAAVSRAAGLIGSAARLLGNLGEKVENLATRADLTAEVAGMLAQVPYDQLNVRLSRDPSLNVKLTEFSLVSPSVRLQGDGQITYEAGKDLLDQPLQLRVNMGVMGSVENALSRAKSSLLSGERDELGYMKLRDPFVIGGTAGKPDPGQLYAMLGRSLLDMFLR